MNPAQSSADDSPQNEKSSSGNIYAEYHHKDHLGNVRVAFTDRNDDHLVTLLGTANDIEVTQQLDYYPFGLQQQGQGLFHTQQEPGNRYRYNGKEIHEDIGLYEYGFRWYDPAIGRFTAADPISDQFAWVSVYNYAENEPIASIDLHGLQRLRVTGGVVRGRPYTKYPNQEMPHLSTQVGASLKHPGAASQIGYFKSGSNNISSVVGRMAAHIDNKIGLDKAAGSSILSGDIGGYQNAIRHGIWSATIASKFGADAALEITNSHEGIGIDESGSIDFSKPNNGNASLADSMVDFLNNQIGISIGEANQGASVSDIAGLILSEFAENGLWTATQDADGNISIQRTKITQGQSKQGQHIVNELLDGNGREK